jgi:hypothetical protein
MIVKSLPRKQVYKKKCLRKNFVDIFYGSKMIFSKTALKTKNFKKNCLVEKLFMVEK